LGKGEKLLKRRVLINKKAFERFNPPYWGPWATWNSQDDIEDATDKKWKEAKWINGHYWHNGKIWEMPFGGIIYRSF
jgi:hypothetical protein